jgi:hypothetical protein
VITSHPTREQGPFPLSFHLSAGIGIAFSGSQLLELVEAETAKLCSVGNGRSILNIRYSYGASVFATSRRTQLLSAELDRGATGNYTKI